MSAAEPDPTKGLAAPEQPARAVGGTSPSSTDPHDHTTDHNRTTPHQHSADTAETDPVAGHEILCVLGRGGMGVVYKARHEKLNRIVALKMIRADEQAEPREVIRFLAEAEAIAAVRHPNVVQVFDYGECAGRPFMTLEFCSGGSLHQRLRQHGPMTPTAAAELVGKIASGVAAAHDRGIVHRDLKPANVLLDDTGEPKVTDFGLAKRAVGAELTQTGVILGTPHYMAPEQAGGRTKFVGPQADVWSLGVILYESLTGQRPFDSGSVNGILLRVLLDEPTPLRKLVPGLPRDLELICGKCLAKNPADRYPTAHELAADLSAFLGGRPITARPVPWWERTWKWAKRNKVVAGSLAATVLALVGGTAFSVTFAMKEAAERKNKEAALVKVTEEQHNTVAALDAMTNDVVEHLLARQTAIGETEKEFLRKVLGLWDRAMSGPAETAEDRARRAGAYYRVGQLRQRLGDLPGAEAAFQTAAAMYTALNTEQPDEPAHALELSRVRLSWGLLLATTGKPAEAEAQYRAAIELLADSSDTARRHVLAVVRSNLGNLLLNIDRPADAEAELIAARDLRVQLIQQLPHDREMRAGLATVRSNLGHLYNTTKRPQLAVTELAATRDELAKLADEFKGVPDYRRNLGVTLSNLGITLYSLGRKDEATAAFRDSVTARAALAAAFPAVPEYRSDLAAAHSNMGVVFGRTGATDAAIGELTAARDQYAQLVAAFPNVVEYRRGLIRGDQNLGVMLQRAKRAKEAEAVFRRARDQLVEFLTDFPPTADDVERLATLTNDLIDLAIRRGDRAAAVAAVDVFATDPRLTAARAQPQFTRLLIQAKAQVPAPPQAPPPRER